MLELDVVHVAVARHAHHHRPAVHAVDQRLDEGRARHAHELRDFVDRLRVRRGDLLDLAARRVGARRDLARGLLEVGRVAAGVAEGDAVFARIRQHVELVRELAADVARVGFDRIGAEAAARENPLVGFEHRHVARVRRLEGGVERIGVLHQELLRAHEAEARTDLVAELPLDLIDRHGQLTIGVDHVLGEVGHEFLGRRAQRVRMLAAVLETEHARTHRLPAAARLPELGRLEDRHHDFLRARLVQLFAHDLRHLVERTHAERQVGEEAAGDLLHERGAHEQLVRIDFRIPRVFTEGLNHQLGPLHRLVSFCKTSVTARPSRTSPPPRAHPSPRASSS